MDFYWWLGIQVLGLRHFRRRIEECRRTRCILRCIRQMYGTRTDSGCMSVLLKTANEFTVRVDFNFEESPRDAVPCAVAKRLDTKSITISESIDKGMENQR